LKIPVIKKRFADCGGECIEVRSRKGKTVEEGGETGAMAHVTKRR
jgi:hypothetical protein